MSEPPPSFQCPRCGMVSYNPHDIAAGYCGKCHEFTGVPPGPSSHPQDGDPLDRFWTVRGNPLHRGVEGHPITMRQWVEAQNDPSIRIRRQTNFEDRSQVVTFWTGLWDPDEPDGGGFDTVLQRGAEVMEHGRHSTDRAALDFHRMLVDQMVSEGRVIKEEP